MHYGATVCLLATALSACAAPLIAPSTHQQLLSPGSGVVLCAFPTPLVQCRLRVSEHLHQAFDNAALDFDLGERSGNVALDLGVNASYAGAGLDRGHCGLELWMDRVYLAVLVECFGRTSDGRWSRGFGLVDVSASSSVSSNASTPRVVTSSRGSDVTVTFSTRGALDECFLWSPAAGEVDFTPGAKLPVGGRYRLHDVDLGQGRCGASLSAVTQYDAGVWVWRGYQEAGTAAQSILLLVEVAPVGDPVLTLLDAPPLLAGSVMRARCVAPPGVPPANLTWLLDGSALRGDDWNDTLAAHVAEARPWHAQSVAQTLVRTLRAGDSGVRLECRLEHSALPRHRSVGVELIVFAVTSVKSVVRSAVGHRSQLDCLVLAPPNATVQWRREEEPVQQSPLVVVGNDAARHWLVLEDTAHGDFGNFTCTATLGRASVSQTVLLTGGPGTPQWAGDTGHAQLAWRVESVASITGCQLNVRRGTERWQPFTAYTTVEERPGWQLVQFHRLPLTPGRYTVYVRVRNEHGWSPESQLRNASISAGVADCGLRGGGARQLSMGGHEAHATEFPWHVAVFRQTSGQFQPVCGGSLVTTSFFVSAGHCFWNTNARRAHNATLYRAVLGKHSLSWETRDQLEQRRAVGHVHLPAHFGGSTKLLESDIAVVRLASPVLLSPAVQVVCVDWDSSFERRQLVANNMGTVPGWGYAENDTMSATLRFVDLPFVPHEECHASVPVPFQDYLLSDKFCGGFVNRSVAVCPGDSGGGFVFPRVETDGLGRRYFLRGVVSSSPTKGWAEDGKCHPEHRSAFTRVSAYVEWMHGIVLSATEQGV